ncbi:MAG: septal ring lytic transglycosylase RlpA family protein [Gammaproteobacteria bacterium]|nr:MAG: septal ring lytic transglycosylase RlpA family protein [Gammaproteobacteria bacterium]TLZ30844.1 MAG: septal ring lytic transglycosylase RlpA family protein [Gammaproteobacteria bacterium]TLZ47610.1 MAG: septal ring lytic transglycosylase RlpA family protein [Gammaproteobacteria bacterium]
MSAAQRPPAPLAAASAAALCVVLTGCAISARRAPQPPERLPPPAAVPPPPVGVESIPDAVPRLEPRSAHGNPPFYDVLGRRYFVLAAADGYLERGVASWYGPTFHGGNTSSGEPYDMYGMSAAHRTLPLPTYARVTNLRNGRSVVVRINDRGPFVANRLIDLSYTAAAKLDMIRDGTTLVEVRALTPGAPDELTRSAQSPPPSLYVQAGAFADAHNAQHLLERLHAAGLASAFILSPLEGRSRLYRVRLGPVSGVAEFDSLAARLAALGIRDARLALD